MSNWTMAVARFRMSAFGGLGVPAATCATTAHAAAVSAYKPLIDARNDVQGGANAWSPPV